MKRQIIIASLMLFSMGFAFAQGTDSNSISPMKPLSSEKVVTYTCSMHPEINSDKPGKCPVCGMDLVVKAAPQYTCSMHPEIVSSSPGKCPKCGMELVLKTPELYSCPKHPEITSSEPGRCSICGKKLKLAESHNHTMMHGCCGM